MATVQLKHFIRYSLGQTTRSGTRPTFPSRRGKISWTQWPGAKGRKRVEGKSVKRKDLNSGLVGGFRWEGLTVSPEHPVLCLVRHGDTCGFHFLHKGLVQSGRRHRTAGQNGLRHNKEHTSDDACHWRRDKIKMNNAAHRRRGFMVHAGTECAFEPVFQPGDYHPT